MFIYKVWRDGFDGCDATDSYWLSKQMAQQRCQEKQATDPDIACGFDWQVIRIETQDDPDLS